MVPVREVKHIKCRYCTEHSSICLVHDCNHLCSSYLLQEGLEQMMESWGLVKRGICSIMLPMINTNSPSATSYSVVSFCKSNSTVFEISLQTLNQVCFSVYRHTHTHTCNAYFWSCPDSDLVFGCQFLLELMLTKPDEMATVAGMGLLVFDQLQNQTSLWDSLLIIPELLSSGSIDQGINNIKSLLTNIQG